MPKSIATCTVYIHHICTIARDGVWLWTDQECTLMQSGAVYYFHNFFPNCISNKGSILAYSHNYGGWFWNHTSHIYVAVLEGYCYCPRMNNKKNREPLYYLLPSSLVPSPFFIPTFTQRGNRSWWRLVVQTLGFHHTKYYARKTVSRLMSAFISRSAQHYGQWTAYLPYS